MKGAYNFVPGVMEYDPDADLRDDDGHFDRSRKRARNDGKAPARVCRCDRSTSSSPKPSPTSRCRPVNLATIILVAVYILQVPVAGSPFWLSVISLLFVITALALGLLISTLVKTQVAAMLASGDGADDAHQPPPSGHDVSDRKYAGRITGTVGRYPGALVHRSGQKSDDPKDSASPTRSKRWRSSAQWPSCWSS